MSKTDEHWMYSSIIICSIVIINHYDDVIMTTMASHITSLTVVYSTVYSDADQRKHQSSASLAFVWGIHRDRWIPRTKGQLRGNVSIWWRHHVIFAQGNVFMHNVYDTVFSHKASFSLGRYLHHLFPSLDINLLLNAIEKCRRMYMNFLTVVYTRIYNEYIWWEIIFRINACFKDILTFSAHVSHIFCS